jgi:hypothetical protein
MFALIIGIENYLKVPKVHVAVSSALDIASYLEKDIGVPKSNILMLLDADASRYGIINALRYLAHDVKIEEGDVILIYYIGHCWEVSTPATWTADPGNTFGIPDRIEVSTLPAWTTDGEKTPCILPYDFHPGNIGIPDRIFGYLIEGIRRNKGDNIVCPGKHICV